MSYDKVAALLAEHLEKNVEDIKPETTFAELGLDSLDTVEMVMELEDAFGISIEMDASIQSVKDIVAIIDAGGK